MGLTPVLLFAVAHAQQTAPPPNIVFIVTDDMGFNDVSLHGSQQVPTPNIDSIAHAGVTLNRYYTQPVCSPTRATIMTGRHAIHHGIYLPFDHGVGVNHLQLNFTLLPAYLKRAANYSTHAIAKWHLGGNSVSATPTGRGFDSFMGYWCGALDYETHQVSGQKGLMIYDFHNTTRDTDEALVDAYGTFSTYVFSAAATDRIAAQGAAGAGAPPLFLYLAWQNIHWPLQAPAEYVARFANTTGGDSQRNYVAAMLAFVDDAIGNVTRAITAAGLDDNTLIVLVSDNGGPTHGEENTASSNFPLRGGKNTLWEGGVRVVGMVKGPGVAPGVTSSAYVHATDWLPSLVSMATGGKDFKQFAPPGEPPYLDGDGLDVWESIASGGASPSPRNWLLFEAHSNPGAVHGNSLTVGDLKILQYGQEAPVDEDGWWPPPGEDSTTTPYVVVCTPGAAPRVGAANVTQCKAPAWCLFNITDDPCEYNDISSTRPADLAKMIAAIAPYQAAAVPPNYGQGCNPSITCVDAPLAKKGKLSAYWPCDGKFGNVSQPCA